MSTILLTETHIGSDHTVVIHEKPMRVIIDPNYKKLFISPNNKFIVGMVGEFDQSSFENPETFDMFEKILQNYIEKRNITSKSGYVSFRDENLYKQLMDKLHKSTQIDDSSSKISFTLVVVSKNYRFGILTLTEVSDIFLKPLGKVVGMGAGGNIGTGMLLGGMDIKDVWKPLSDYVDTSSEVSTIISLSSLRKGY